MKSVIVIILLLWSSATLAEISVIVHPSNGNALEAGDIQRIFLGKKKSFADGSQAEPINLKSGDVRSAFEENALNKSSSQLKAYWSKLVFTGKGTPPEELATEDDIVVKVASTPGAIAYVDSSKVTGDVKVVATF